MSVKLGILVPPLLHPTASLPSQTKPKSPLSNSNIRQIYPSAPKTGIANNRLDIRVVRATSVPCTVVAPVSGSALQVPSHDWNEANSTSSYLSPQNQKPTSILDSTTPILQFFLSFTSIHSLTPHPKPPPHQQAENTPKEERTRAVSNAIYSQ